MIVLIVAASLLIGVSLGVLGGGGSILTVPLLVYLAGQDTKEAVATSLLVVGVTSLAALIPHARARRVHWRTGSAFGAFSMVGAYGGGRIAEYVPGTALLVAFGLMMLATATAMLRRPRGRAGPGPQRQSPSPVRVAVLGVGAGAVTGLVGSGGGFLVVPALAVLGGLPIGIAVGTSLLVIAMNSFAGLAGHLSGAHLDRGLALTVTAAAVVGSVAGARFAGRIPQEAVRRAFGWFVVVMGVLVLAQQIEGGFWGRPAVWGGLGGTALAVAACALVGRRRTGRARSRASGKRRARRRPHPHTGAGRTEPVTER
ncbi:sulfite exporter TauE/SafE family protein [Streptomyces sp. NPDC056069]|uniref:sulfite exporter TauE/SafE family protein n=1 Tax=Streptomyces sp. NPDC056069 TaxID=3345702 RepID=UPI0035D9F5F1